MYNIFISYAHEDTEWLNELHKYLTGMLRRLEAPYDEYTVWYDDRVRVGDPWSDELRTAMDESRIAILMLSQYYLASQFIMDEELPYLLKLRETRRLQLAPLLIRACQWADHPRFKLGKLQAHPWELKPLNSVPVHEAEAYLLDFVRDIEEVVRKADQTLGDCPYRGLFAFQEDDRDIFCGRGDVGRQYVADLARKAVLPIAGSSGCGKSSLVNAGIIPLLRDEHWSVLTFRPGRTPLAALARELADWFAQNAAARGIRKVNAIDLEDRLPSDPGHILKVLKSISETNQANPNVLIFVDQFEELFTNCTDKARKEFLDVLFAFTKSDEDWTEKHLHVVFTLRFDFLELATKKEEALASILKITDVKILTEMSDGDLRDAIEQPAKKRGAAFERGLIEQIIREVGYEQGKLPLLEFCLQQLWDQQKKRGGAILTKAAYEELGTFKGAITDYAEREYSELDEKEKVAAREMFKQLVNVASGDDQRGDTRRPASREELCQIKKIGDRQVAERVLKKLVEARLLVANRSAFYEVSHEILIRAWDRLKGWVDEDREFMRKRKDVERSLKEYERSGDHHDFLQGSLLDDCEVWLRKGKELKDKEVEFINLSLANDAETQVIMLLRSSMKTLYEDCERLRHRDAVNRVLHDRIALNPPDEIRRRLSLALVVGSEETQVDYLARQLLSVDPDEFLVIRKALVPYKRRLIDTFWEVSLNPQAPQNEQIRATCALALYDQDSANWERIKSRIANRLVGENPLLVTRWIEALVPVRQILIDPLVTIFGDPGRPEPEREMAAGLLVDYVGVEPKLLAELAVLAEPKQFITLLPAIRATPGPVVDQLVGELEQLRERVREQAREREESATSIPKDVHDAVDRRYALTALKLTRLGQSDRLWPLLPHSRDPGPRSHLIHLVEPSRIDPQVLLDRLVDEPDVSARRALLLALGEYPDARVPAGPRNALVERLRQGFRDEPDPGFLAATTWLLRRWGLDSKLTPIWEELVSQEAPAGRGWYRNAQGQTFTVVRAPEVYWMGSPRSEAPDRDKDEQRHRRRIDRAFAIATEPVTNRQFQKFRDAHPEIKVITNERFSKDPDCPVINISWFTAAQYCRWLSEQEGLLGHQMCYPSVDEIEEFKQTIDESNNGATKPALTIPPGYLRRTGYRLPTEAEWEYAARAGAETARPHGTGATLLPYYGWFMANSSDCTQPVGLLKPNDLGLFDVLGNVYEWCHDQWARDYEVAKGEGVTEDREFPTPVTAGQIHVLRGGSFAHSAIFLRSARRMAREASHQYDFIGFRVARTHP